MNILNEISQKLQQGNAKAVKELVLQAIEEKLEAEIILEQGLMVGMDVIGRKFKNNEIYVPEVLIAARAMNIGTELLKPLLSTDDAKAKGKVILGTVEGDLHDIGKNLVKIMMEGKGLDVVDLGIDVPCERFIEAAQEENADIIACSALLTTTMDEMGKIVEAAKEAGIRDKVTIMIGGAPITDSFCQSIGADIYKPDAASAAEAAAQVCQK